MVVRKGAGIRSIKDLHHKKIASPQLGNTQDVSLRVWLKRNGMVLSDKGGDVQVIPVKNSDQLTLFLNKQIDGAWTVEPWVSRLVNEGGGEVFLEESSLWPDGEYVTACVIANKKFLYAHPDLVKKWLNVHVKLTLWINAHPAEAKIIMNKGLKNLTRAVLSESVLDSSFARLKITYDPIKSSLSTFAQSAFEQGFLGKNKPELTGIYDLKILNEILKERGLKTLD